jgi:hypothetical protein
MRDIIDLIMPGSRDGGDVTIDTCWIEVDRDGAVGPDFGWPAEADKFAYLGSCPRSGSTWVELLTDWLQARDEGEGVEERWARGNLDADEVADLLDHAFPGDPGAGALKTRLDERNRYIVFAQLRRWRPHDGDDDGSGDDDGGNGPEPLAPLFGAPLVCSG